MTDTTKASGADFVPLHCHSYFSILDGLDSPEAMVARAVELGHPAMAITDHGVCSGLYRFHEACKNVRRCTNCGKATADKNETKCEACEGTLAKLEVPFKPILGMEGYVVDNVLECNHGEARRHITIWAKDPDGYRNLIWLSTFGCTSGAYEKPRISLDLLAEHRNGLAVGTACASGMLCKSLAAGNDAEAISMLGRLKDIFGGDVYVEFMNHDYVQAQAEHQAATLASMKRAIEIADSAGVKSIYTYDSHYVMADDARVHDVLLSVQTGNTIKNPNRMTFGSSNFYMQGIGEIVARSTGRMDLIRNTLEVAEKVQPNILFKMPFQKLLPPFPLPSGYKDEVAYLKSLVREGMKKRNVYHLQAYRDRITRELDAIIKLGFVRYFLVLHDAVAFAKRNGIPVGAGRGSAAGSLVIYCLEITQLDPIKYGLFFERFINPDRVSPPDVDIDYASDRQEEMFRYCSEKYGQEFTARIATYGTLGAKDAIKRVGKALDVGNDWEAANHDKGSWKSGPKTLALLNAITKCMAGEKPGTSLSEIMEKNEEVKEYVAQYPVLFELAKRMEGTVMSAGKHAAGVVLCNRPLVDVIPIRLDNDGHRCSQFDKDEVEPLGLLKYDFLGLKNLCILSRCLKLIKEREGLTIDLDALEPNDPAVFKMLNDGHVHGIFQFEGGDGRKTDKYGNPVFHTMSGLLMNMRVDSFDDMVACVALFRPGTLKGVWDGKPVPETYCDYKHKRRPVKYLHPKMETLLAETHGLMVYQEQVMLVAREIAGFTMSEADTFRKGIGKKDPALVQSLKQKFIDGCKKNEVSDEVAAKIFELCESFSGYGFNKAHAACYAFIGYQCAYLKRHHLIEFAAALLSTNLGDEVKLAKLEKIFERMGIRTLPHDINHSKAEYSIEGNCLRRPLTSLKGLSDKSVPVIVAAQPFRDVKDFVRKISGQAVNRAVFETLVKSGCMNGLGMTQKDAIASYEDAKEAAKDLKRKQELERKKNELFGSLSFWDSDE